MKFKIIPAQHLVVETLIDLHPEYHKDDKYKDAKHNKWISFQRDWGRIDREFIDSNEVKIFKDCNDISEIQNLINNSINSLTPISKDKNEKSFYNNQDYNNFYNIRNIENKLDLDIDYLWAGSTGGGSSLNMIFHNGVDDNEISKVENMLNDMVPLDTIADDLNYSFETEEYHQTPIKVKE